jgi:condensin-2 complex subunit D3
MSLGLDRRGSDSFLSQQSEVDCDLYRPSIQSMRTGAWCLLDALTSCLLNGNGDKVASTSVSLKQAVRASSIDSSFLALSLKKLRSLINSPDVPFDKRPSLIIASRDCFKVTAKMASFVPIQEAEDCFSDLFNDLKTFRMVIDLIPAAVSALVALSKRLCDDSGKDVFHECEQWITKLLIQCERAMESSLILLARRSGSVEVEEKITRISFLVGELSIVGFSSDDVPGKGIQNLATEKEPVRGLAVRPSAQLLQSIKLMMPNSMPVPGSPDDAFVPIPSAIRAHGFVTMGKLCLRDERLAKECLNILARELHRNTTTDPAVQTNCLMVMGDLCVRYTNLVDKYLPFMAACIQAGDAKGLQVVGPETYSRLSVTFDGTTGDYSLVKKNAILLLSSLLLQDYIKWRGLFVFRFLAGVADKDDEVSCLARAAIRGPLLEKQPNLLSSSFVESIFVFNNYKAHPIYATAASSGGAGCVEIDFEPGILDGTEGYQRRHEVYQMMLENMSGEQKLKVTTEIVKRILGGALETSGDLGIVCRLAPKVSTKISISRIDSATHVLRDALAILSSPQIKVGRRVSDVAEQDDEFAEGSNAKTDQRNVNKERLLSKISRKHLMEIVIPVLCNLKSVLETSHSTLLKDLMKYLGYIFRSFKREVSEQLANDPTLLQELEYDTRQFEKNQGESILNAEIVADDA